MTSPDFWKAHYVVETTVEEVQQDMKVLAFTSGGRYQEMVSFTFPALSRNILISQGTAGHAYVFAELAHFMHASGFNVFVMPKHGGVTVNELLTRHLDAVRYISGRFGPDISAYGEGLGGYIVFYMALAHAPLSSIACENSPAILTDRAYRQALAGDGGPWVRAARHRKWLIPLAIHAARLVPRFPVPISSYLPWEDLIDVRRETTEREHRLVVDGYLRDPGFDRWYPLAAVASLLSTPSPGPLDGLQVPTMFIVASEGPTPGYIIDLHARLPDVPSKLVHVDGSVFWMLSHPKQAAALVCSWFGSQQLSPAPEYPAN